MTDSGGHKESPAETILEMGVSRAEFLRGLNHLVNEAESLFQIAESEWELRMPTASLRIIFHELPPRETGALSLPRARVVLAMRALTPAQRGDFVHRFRRVFQRGGG